MRLATWNVNSLNARLERVTDWLAALEPDVLCLQETKLSDDDFPRDVFSALGYESAHHGEGQWNGVAILSRVGLTEARGGFDDGGEPDRDARILWATCNGVRIASCYVPNGRSLDDEHYAYKLAWLARLRSDLDANANSTRPIAVMGDFNIAPDDRDIYEPDTHAGSTHVSAPERARLTELTDWGLTDLFRDHHQEAGLYSWWDYRGGNFHRRMGMRIDLLLGTESVRANTTRVFIDRNARKGKLPSDHAPVVADTATPT